MRDLFKLDGARIWGGLLIFAGAILLTVAFFLRWNMPYISPVPEELVRAITNTAVLTGLGITLIILGITVIILCKNITHMMHVYDEELYRRIKNVPPNADSD